MLKINWDKYKDIIKNMKNKEILNKELKKIYLKNVLNIIEREIKSVKEISFTQLYYKSKIMQNNKNLIKEKYKKCNIEKTDLDNVYKTLLKNKFDVYVDFFPDAINGFCLYNDMERDKLHDAGYDSIITGRSFILMNKALENGFETTNVIKQNMALGEKNLGEKKDEIVIKYGFTDKNIFNEYSNKTFLSLVESEKNGIINWNVGNEGQNEEEYIKGEKELITN